MNTPHETTSEETCCINCDDLGNCAFADCKCHYAMSEEVKENIPCTCPKGGRYSDGQVCEKCDGIEYIMTSEEVKEKWEDIVCSIRKGSMDDKQFRATVEHCFSQQRSLAQQEILDRAIDEQPEKKYNGKHNSAHTYITEGYCHACKKQLTREQMIEEFGYNQAIDDYIHVLSTLKDTNI